MKNLSITFLIIITSMLLFSCGGGTVEYAHEFKKESNILWASPDGFDLTMDIYTPQTGKSSYPVLIIYHGGGWLINDQTIMDDMSAYMSGNAEYVVCNVNYRLLGDQENTVTVDQIVEDALGAVAWLKENVAEYGGNPDQIAVTGDSAGGHMAEMVLLAKNNLCSNGFESGNFCFQPSYLPEGVTAEELSANNNLEVQAAVLSYPVVDAVTRAKEGFEDSGNIFWFMGGADPRGFMGAEYNVNDHTDRYAAVSPMHLLRSSEEMTLPPQFIHVGSEDEVTPPTVVNAYFQKVIDNGHQAEYWVHEGRNHAYLDSGSNIILGNSFSEDAIEPLNRIIAFLDGVFE